MTKLLAGVGIPDKKADVYRENIMENLCETVGFTQFNRSDSLSEAITASEKSMELLLPNLLSCGLVDADTAAASVIEYYLRHRDTVGDSLDAASFIQNTIVPLLEKMGISGWVNNNMTVSCSVSRDQLPTFASFDGTVRPQEKMLVVYYNEDKDTYAINTTVTAALPGVCVPVSVEEADKILLVSTHWEQTGTNNGITLYDAISKVTLHDAKTGDCLMMLGQLQDGLSGFRMVSGKQYKEPVHWNRVIELYQSVIVQKE